MEHNWNMIRVSSTCFWLNESISWKLFVRWLEAMLQISLHDCAAQKLMAESWLCLISELMSVLSCFSAVGVLSVIQWVRLWQQWGINTYFIQTRNIVNKNCCSVITQWQCSWQCLLFQQKEDRRRQVQLVSQVSSFLSSGQRLGVLFTVLDSFCYCMSHNLGYEL